MRALRNCLPVATPSQDFEALGNHRISGDVLLVGILYLISTPGPTIATEARTLNDRRWIVL